MKTIIKHLIPPMTILQVHLSSVDRYRVHLVCIVTLALVLIKSQSRTLPHRNLVLKACIAQKAAVILMVLVPARLAFIVRLGKKFYAPLGLIVPEMAILTPFHALQVNSVLKWGCFDVVLVIVALYVQVLEGYYQHSVQLVMFVRALA
jgi:hypothetical protein